MSAPAEDRHEVVVHLELPTRAHQAAERLAWAQANAAQTRSAYLTARRELDDLAELQRLRAESVVAAIAVAVAQHDLDGIEDERAWA